MSAVLLVLAGGAVGAVVRYLTGLAVRARHDSPFPWGTFMVNVAGSLLAGVLVGGAEYGAVSDRVLLLAGVGFCGALTTYSTFSYETYRLATEGEGRLAAVNVIASVATTVIAAALGWAMAYGVWR